MLRFRSSVPALAMLLGASACVPAAAPLPDPRVEVTGAEIQIAPDGRCLGRDVTPAVIQTVTAQELEAAEVRDANGAVVTPARYRSVIRQQIVRDRQVILFETICPPLYTAAFVESLQRALLARGFYRGAVSGHLNSDTSRAIQDFQRDFGPDSPLLSVAAARRLGLIALTSDQIDELSSR